MRSSAWLRRIAPAAGFSRDKLSPRCRVPSLRFGSIGSITGLVCGLLLGAFATVASEPGVSDLKVAAFSCDVTPPLGHPLCGGWIKPLEAVDDPLLAKGTVLSDRQTRYVLCAVDWCLLQTGAYDAFRRKLAVAAGVPESQVSVHTVHQYNDGSPQSRVELTERIYRAMKEAAAGTNRTPVRSLEWRTTRVRLSPRLEPEWSETAARQTIANTNATTLQRITAALNLAWLERLAKNPNVDISRLKLGPVTSLHLPGEAFIEYQLYADSLRPAGFLAVAAYGESGPGYFCLDAALTAGGYEPTMSRVGPPSEFELKRGIARLLEPARRTSAPFYADKRHLLAWRDTRGIEHPVRTAKDWEKRRAHILAGMASVMGETPRTTRKVPLDVQVIAEELLPDFARRQITFASEAGDRVPAYLLIPRQLKAKAPAMVCLHQTVEIGKREPAGLGGSTNLQYAAELARRGYVTLVPDYPGFGDYRFDAYAAGYASATMKGIWNHQRAVDLLESLPEVDGARIGAIGHSLGGHNALFLAAFEPRIRAVVTSCGFNSFFNYGDGDLTGWSHAGYMPRIASVFGKDPRLMPFDFTEVLAAIAPRPVFINAPMRDTNFEVGGVMDCVACAGPVYRLLGAGENLVAAHPDCGHDFPPRVRQSAYDWLDSKLKPGR